MNAIQLVEAVVRNSYPDARTNLAKPLRADGFWSLDVRRADHHLAVDWREADGFSLTADAEHGFGEAADESYAEFASALPRILHVIEHGLDTVPPDSIRVRELRERTGLSQSDVAREMGVQQAAVSKLESREDSHIGTLSHYIAALGGKLVLKAVFPNREQEIHLVGAG